MKWPKLSDYFDYYELEDIYYGLWAVILSLLALVALIWMFEGMRGQY